MTSDRERVVRELLATCLDEGDLGDSLYRAYKRGLAAGRAEERALRVTVVDEPGGEWVGLYIDDKLIFEGHNLNWHQFADLVGFSYTAVEADEQWLLEVGRLPVNLADVRLGP